MKGIIIFIMMVLGACGYGQVPEWVEKVPMGYMNDYFSGKGVSKTTRAESIQLASEDAIISIVRTGRITVKYSEMDSLNYMQSGTGINSEISIVAKTMREVSISGESKTIKGLKLVETYTEFNSGIYESWVLMSVPKAHPEKRPSHFGGVMKSVFIPGWGQFSRGEKIKGAAFLSLTAGALISGFVLNELSSNASRDAQSSRTQVRRDYYNERARTYNTFSIISFIAAIGLYAWNVADAVVVKDETGYAIRPFTDGIFCFETKIIF